MSNGRQEFWDNFAQNYTRVELTNFQGGLSTFILAKANLPGARVLEVGCGSGVGTEITAQSLLSKVDSPVLVTSDFSTSMLGLCKTRMEESDYPLVQGNKLVFDTDTDFVSNSEARVDLDSLVE